MSNAAPRTPGGFAWLDMEMSGLDPASCLILEVATIVTDAELRFVAEGPSLVVHQEDSVLEAMDEWNTSHHTDSGLVAMVKASSISVAEAEQQTLDFLAEHFAPGKAILAGNSIGQDRRFIRAYMPKLDAFLHYRMLDVTAVKILAASWYPEAAECPPKKECHRALDDIRESVAELAHYRSTVFRNQSSGSPSSK